MCVGCRPTVVWPTVHLASSHDRQHRLFSVFTSHRAPIGRESSRSSNTKLISSRFPPYLRRLHRCHLNLCAANLCGQSGGPPRKRPSPLRERTLRAAPPKMSPADRRSSRKSPAPLSVWSDREICTICNGARFAAGARPAPFGDWQEYVCRETIGKVCVACVGSGAMDQRWLSLLKIIRVGLMVRTKIT